jgi:hypothetical protein
MNLKGLPFALPTLKIISILLLISGLVLFINLSYFSPRYSPI